MVDLDDPKVFERLDPSGMRNRLRSLPSLCQRGWSLQPTPSLPPNYRQVERIVVLGMGGSAIGGDLLRDLLAREGGPRVEVCRDFSLNRPLDERTLVIASSYSGNTEEVLACYQEASRSPSPRLAITSGGRLKALAEKNGIPVYTIDVKSEPRTALGFTFFTLLGCISHLGLAADVSEEVKGTIQLLEEMMEDLHEAVPLADNPAKTLASQLMGRLIVIYGSDIFSAVALRWKTQFNENSKAWAFHEVLPEAGHNGVEGFVNPNLISGQTQALLLYSSALPDALKSRCEVVEELLARGGVVHHRVEARGTSPLSQMMSLVLMGDYVSYYLGILYGIDPSSVPSIDHLKGRLAGITSKRNEAR